MKYQCSIDKLISALSGVDGKVKMVIREDVDIKRDRDRIGLPGKFFWRKVCTE